MANFNPQITPTQDKNYFSYSKAIEQPSFHSSMAEGLKGAGELISKAAKGVDEFIEDKATIETRNTMEAARDTEIDRLAAAKAQITYSANAPVTATPETAQAAGPGVPQNILADSTTGLPNDIKNMPHKLSAMTEARANGHISETHFDMLTNMMLKDIRAKYPPAYYPVIDREASRVLGKNPANATIQSLIGDINAAAAGSQAQFNHMFNELSTKGLQFPGGQEALAEFMQTRDVNKAASFLAPNLARKYTLDMKDAELRNSKATGDALKDQYRFNANEHASAAVQEVLHGAVNIAGISEKDIQDVIVQANAGKFELTPVQYEQMANRAKALKQQYIQNIRQRFSDTSKGVSINGVLTFDDANKITDSGSKVFDEMIDAFNKKDVGLAYDAMNRVRALDHQTQYSLQTNPNFGESATKAKIAKDMFGPTIYGLLIENQVKAGISKDFTGWLQNKQEGLADPKSPVGLKDTLQELLHGDRTTQHPSYKFDMPKTFEALQQLYFGPTSITSSRMPQKTKEAIVSKSFSPENWGALAGIAPDSTDSQGRRVKGIQSVFAGFTNPDLVLEVNKQGQSNAKTRSNYLNWVENTAVNDVLKPDALVLKDVDYQHNGQTGFNSPNKWQIRYDNENGEFQLIRNGANLIRQNIRNLDSNVRPYAESINHINSVLSSLRNVGEGMQMKNAHLYALETFLQSTGKGDMNDTGKVTGFDVLQIPGLPIEITQPVEEERKQALETAKKNKELFKVK